MAWKSGCKRQKHLSMCAFYKTKRIDARLHSLQGRARKENKSAIFFNIY